LFKRGEIIQRNIKGIQIGGAAPRGEWPFAIDVKGGEIITLMCLMSINGRDLCGEIVTLTIDVEHDVSTC
jgi:hypothetical protein